LKETIEVEDYIHLDRKEDEISSGGAEHRGRARKDRKISQKRVRRLKKAFKPSQLREIIEIFEDNNNGKNDK
jgi:hypothetical protein